MRRVKKVKLIGISGEAGSGKSTISSLYRETIGEVFSASLSDLIREFIENVGLVPDRDLQRFVGNYRRKTLGSNYWVKEAINRMNSNAKILLLTGIYAVDEVKFIKQLGGILVWVDANEEARLTRIKKRCDGPRDQLAFNDSTKFLEQLKAEKGQEIQSGGEVSLEGVKALADFTIDNSGNMANLENEIIKLNEYVAKNVYPLEGNLAYLVTEKDIDYRAPSNWSDNVKELEQLLKEEYFERFLGGGHSEDISEPPSIKSGLPLNEVIKSLYRPNLRSITGNQTGKRISSIFMEEDPRTALGLLRKFKPSNQEEEYFAGLEDEDFYDLHLQAHLSWRKDEPSVFGNINNRLEKIKECDKLQFSSGFNRSLNRMKKEGVIFSITPDAVSEIKKLGANPILRYRPILEFVKNDKIIQVSGFKNSKASLVIHDAIDHLWTFNLLQRIGLLKKYKELFDAIGNPEKTDIFRREGETVASISFGVRAFQGISPGFNPLINTKDIVKLVREMRGKLGDRHTEALRIINNLESNGPEWRSLSYVFSNYLTELDEQRRTFGRIKFKKPNSGKIEGELDPFSPDYLCFFIETHHELLNSTNKHRNALFFTHYIFEEYLRAISKGFPFGKLIKLTPDALENEKLEYDEKVPREASAWMFENYGFTTNRNRNLL